MATIDAQLIPPDELARRAVARERELFLQLTEAKQRLKRTNALTWLQPIRIIMAVCGLGIVFAFASAQPYAPALVHAQLSASFISPTDAVQDSRLAALQVNVDELKKDVKENTEKVTALQNEIAWMKGAGFGFGGLLALLNSLQAFLQFRGSREGRNGNGNGNDSRRAHAAGH